MRGYFAIEALFVLFLIPYLLYLTKDQFFLPRETIEITNDLAQIVSYGFEPPNTTKFMFWVGNVSYGSCSYRFRYCTKRYVPRRGELRICAAECSPYWLSS